MAVVNTIFEDAILKKPKSSRSCTYVAGDSDIDLIFSMEVDTEPTALADKLAR